jgi:2-polyprenyl-3-methyl-5-hydroxy-6-metoxy-1,4-benzoquinol methylase
MPTLSANHFDRIAKDYDLYKRKNWYYYSSLRNLLKSLTLPNKNILEIGCGTGDVLAGLQPKIGMGLDPSTEMITLAQQKYPQKNLGFKVASAEDFRVGEKFDYIIMTDVIEHLADVNRGFSNIGAHLPPDSSLIITMANPAWEPLLLVAEKLRLKMPEGPHHRISFNQIDSICSQNGLRITRHSYTLLCPVFVPILTKFINHFLEPVFRNFCFIEYFIVTRPT